jgi:hypothetical protein
MWRGPLRLQRGAISMATYDPKVPGELSDWPIEMLKIVEPHEAERLCSLSWDSIRRNHPDKIIHLSKRRVGMRVGHALMLSGVKP